MSFRSCITFFPILLSFCFLSTWTVARPPHDQSHGAEVVVDIVNALPSSTQVQLQLGCEGPYSYLELGHHFNRSVRVGQGLECTAEWLPLFNTWDAYEAERDKGHDTIYWLVKKDGFYHSWDGSQWKMLYHWYTE